MSEVKVSVFVVAYNQEKYIAKTLESIITQKADFKFEVLVHDDASTDSTPSIIKEYALKYPDLIFPVFQTENQYSKGIKIATRFLLPYANGEYIAWLDGDDYWNNENKLQLQIDAVEKENASACIHKVEKKQNGKTIGFFPNPSKLNQTCVLEKTKAFELAISGEMHLSSMLIKKSSYMTYVKNFQKYSKDVLFEDIPTFAFIAANEKVVYLESALSVYNVGVNDGYMATVFTSQQKMIEHYKKSIEYYKLIYGAFPLFSQKKVIKERLQLEEYLLQVVLRNYKVIFAKDNKDFFKQLAPKHKLKLMIGRMFPSLVENYERKKQKKG